ncbi:MAG TPA: AmmeMemoRadiSam system protein A [Candidatus Binatia bacterium]
MAQPRWVMADVYLPADSQRRLIKTARQTLEAITRGHHYGELSESDPHLERVNYGAFVTLLNENLLRGCVGTCAPSSGLSRVVIEMTEAAARYDRRVKPVSVDELDNIQIHISVISPLDTADHPLDLAIGKHGLHIARHSKRGVLLPQVAVEHGWNASAFLEHTCLKANLPSNAWRWPGTSISLFTSLQIEEER